MKIIRPVLGVLVVVLIVGMAVGVAGCKKKPADKATGGADMTSMKQAMPAAMDVGMRPAPGMRPVARKAPAVKLKATNPEAVKILDAALKAHGGLDAIQKKTAAAVVEAKGKYYGQAYTAKNYWKAPDKMLMDIVSMKVTMGYIGKTCWSKIHEVVIDCPPDEAKVAQQMQLAQHWSMLYPLKEKGVSLQLVKTGKVNGQETVGITASKAGLGFRITFSFYKKTNLLAGWNYRGHWSGGKLGLLSTVVLGYKKVDGLQYPFKSILSFNGKMIIQEELTKITLGKVDEKVFGRPKQVELGKGILRKINGHTAAFTVHKGAYTKLGAAVGALVTFITKAKLSPMGPPVFVYLKMGKDAAMNVTEIRMAVAPFKGGAPKAKGFGVKKIPATLHALSYVKGPYTALGAKYKQLGAFVKKSKHKIVGPAHMVGLSNPAHTKPADLLNRVSFPVKK